MVLAGKKSSSRSLGKASEEEGLRLVGPSLAFGTTSLSERRVMIEWRSSAAKPKKYDLL